MRQLAFALVALGLCLGARVASAQPGASLEALNRALEALNREHAASGQAAEVLGQMLDVATERQHLLAALVEHDPGQVLASAIPADIRGRFPAAVQAKLERHVHLQGEVTVVFEDHQEHAVLRHSLKANGRRRSLHFADRPPALMTGDRVRVRGVEVPLDGASSAVVAYCCGVDGVLALTGGNGGGKKGGGGAPAPAPAPVLHTTGEHRVLVLLVNFQDAPLEPYSPAQAQSVVFGPTADFIKENSYQQTWLTGDVAGWYTLPLESTQCDPFAIASSAKSAASAAGFDLAAYQHFVYAFPSGGCGALGWGTLGGNPGEVWIIGDLNVGVVGHELGHNLGLQHAHALDCGATVLGASCSVFEYGDRIDTMGNVAAGHYNAFDKELLGWFGSGAAPVVTEVQAAGVYTIEPLELSGTSQAALAILKSVDPTTGEKTWYYVEYRSSIGFDAFLATNENVLNGVIVHTGSPSNSDSSMQLDMTPGSGLQNWSDWSDPALDVGQTFSDPEAGVTITPLSVGPAAAEVSVTIGVPNIGGTTSGLAVIAVSDRAVYRSNQTARISATVTANGAPVANASVSFLITDPDGGTKLQSATTGSDGVAGVDDRFGRRDPSGEYQVQVEATTSSSLRADAWTRFVLQ